jgi:hypothetical protein
MLYNDQIRSRLSPRNAEHAREIEQEILGQRKRLLDQAANNLKDLHPAIAYVIERHRQHIHERAHALGWSADRIATIFGELSGDPEVHRRRNYQTIAHGTELRGVAEIHGFFWGTCPKTKEVLPAPITRTIFEGCASHDFFYLPRELQKQGLAKDFAANQVRWYRDSGTNIVYIGVALDWGAYVWAKCGFVPTPQAWSKLREDVADRLEQLRKDAAVSTRIYELVRNSLAQESPKAIWDIVDNKMSVAGIYVDGPGDTTLGKALFV